MMAVVAKLAVFICCIVAVVSFLADLDVVTDVAELGVLAVLVAPVVLNVVALFDKSSEHSGSRRLLTRHC